MGDPFLDSILRGLEGELDPKKFEDCAVDLIRRDFPGAAHVPGGNDAGMDGAVPDPNGPPLPIVTTTQKDVVQNLVKSLKSHRKKHRGRKAIFATSRAISTDTRRKLENQAKSLGYTLLQIYQRRTIAELLYRNPRWCRDLLQLTGEPSALSPFPLSARPTLGRKIIARSSTFRWLRQTSGDRILVGQPGIGKTCVLRRYASTDQALFVVDPHRGALANAIRERQPRVIIVDDAHLEPEVLLSLRQMRDELFADYQILATCWPGEREKVQQALAVENKKVRELRLLTRDEIVRVIKAAGVEGPNALIHEIVNQANGRAGLAVSLVHCVLRGDFKRLQKGEELTLSLVEALAASVGKETRQVLAAFALGGEAGMRLADVAEFLRRDLASVHQIISGLESGGVIRPRAQTFAVAPPALQQALVRDVFFNPRAPFDCGPILAKAHPPSAIETLVGAKLRGRNGISSPFIRELFPKHDTNPPCPAESTDHQPWLNAAVAYAYLGPEEARWALDNYTDVLKQAPRVVLERAPDEAIRRLLEQAVDDNRPLNSSPDHSFRILHGWIAEHPQDVKRSVRRRKCLMRAAERWMDDNGDPSVAVRAACIALCTHVELTEADPGAGNSMTISRGLVPLAEVEKMIPLWARLRAIVLRARGAAWKDILMTLHEWAYGHVWPTPDERVAKALGSIAAREIEPFVKLAAGRPAVLSRLLAIARRVQMDDVVPVDQEFEEVLGERAVTEFRHEDWERRVRQIAERWAREERSVVVRRIQRFTKDAAELGVHTGEMQAVCWELARVLPERLTWATELASANVYPDFIQPFLMRAAVLNDEGWAKAAAEWMDQDTFRMIAVEAAVLVSHSPDELFEQALGFPDDVAKCLGNRINTIPIDRMRRLLTYSSRAIATAAAMHELRLAASEARGSQNARARIAPRDEVRDEWRQAALCIVADRDNYMLAEAFGADPQLALEWLLARMDEKKAIYYKSHLIGKAIEVLDTQARRTAIKHAKYGRSSASLLSALIGDDHDLYAWFLGSARDRRLHLIPLRMGDRFAHDEQPRVSVVRVQQALRARHSPSSVAEAAFGAAHSWMGSAAKHFRQWMQAFEPLVSSDDAKLRRVGRLGMKMARERRKWALVREQHEAVHGRRG